MTNNRLMLLILLFSTLSLISCNNGGTMTEEQMTFATLDQLKDSDWDNLAEKKIYFGHMSVGYNIVDGILDLQKQYPQLKLTIVESNDPATLQPGTLAHSKVGKNYSPQSKMADFKAFLNAGLANKTDVAILKFCYLDVLKTTDTKVLFSEYTQTIDKLKLNYPELTLVHCTVPLTKRETGPKSWLKRILGRGIGIEENIRRNEYNELLRAKYKDADPIFDIATIESTNPDGKRFSFKSGEKTYFTLVSEYTYDNGHLNEVGRKKVAEQLIYLLAKIQ